MTPLFRGVAHFLLPKNFSQPQNTPKCLPAMTGTDTMYECQTYIFLENGKICCGRNRRLPMHKNLEMGTRSFAHFQTHAYQIHAVVALVTKLTQFQTSEMEVRGH